MTALAMVSLANPAQARQPTAVNVVNSQRAWFDDGP